MPNEYEARARAIKASKLAAVARRVLAEPGVSLESLSEASADFRQRVARLARTNDPSDATWALMMSMLDADRRYQPDDPFEGLAPEEDR